MKTNLILGPLVQGGTALLFALIAASLPGNAQTQGATAAFQENYADVNGVRLHYASVGSGSLILFLHGFPSFWYQWKGQMTEMGRDHLAVGLDMRGYNLSFKPEGQEPYKMYGNSPKRLAGRTRGLCWSPTIGAPT